MRRTLYIKPNEAAISAAKRGLAARKRAPKSKRGGLDPQQAHAEGVGSGVARARDIAAGKRVNAYQVKAFFDRHRGNYIDAKLKKLKPEESKAIQAWLLWGGEPLRRQAEAVVRKDRNRNPDARAFSGRVIPHRSLPKRVNQIAELMVKSDARRSGSVYVYDMGDGGYVIGDSYNSPYTISYKNNKWFISSKGSSPEEIRFQDALFLSKSYFRSKNPSKKRARLRVSKSASSSMAAKPYVMYVTVEGPRSVSVYPFLSEDYVIPATVANEFRLSLQMKQPKARVLSLNEKQLAKYLRKVGKPISRGKKMRVQNPRRSVLKDALAIEALHYKDFEDFAKAYWENCARGIYWYPTNDKSFSIGAAEKKLSQEGKFFISCNPELALESSRGKGKKYVAEIDVSALGSGDYRIKRGSKGSDIKIVRNINKAKVLRVLRGDKAMRSLIWQQSILPSSKDELRKFYDQVIEKAEARKEKEAKKKRARQERDARRAGFLEKEERAKRQKKKIKAQTKEKISKKKTREKLETKRQKREAKQTRAKSSKKKSTQKKKSSTSLAKTKNPTRLISPYINRPS